MNEEKGQQTSSQEQTTSKYQSNHYIERKSIQKNSINRKTIMSSNESLLAKAPYITNKKVKLDK